MKIKIDNYLLALSRHTNIDAKKLSMTIARELFKAGLIKDTDEFYGQKIINCLADETSVSTICNIMSSCGIKDTYLWIFDFLINCTVIGDGECPECGGFCEMKEHEFNETQSDYDVPPEQIITWARYWCPICGHEFEQGEKQ